MAEAQSASVADLGVKLARAGLIQFGRFVQTDGAIWPVALHLGWLPSYPALLRDVADVLAAQMGGLPAERLLTTPDAVPIGVAVGLRAGLPVTYPRGDLRETAAAFAIEGAYDVGHPTLLLTDTLADALLLEGVARVAQRVGLEVRAVLAVIDLGLGAREDLIARGYQVRTVLALRDLLPELETAGWLPSLMRGAVETWLAHPAGAP